jgi:hypothetical protein
MLGRGVGLIDLVERPLQFITLETDLARAVSHFVWCGQMRMACSLAFPDITYRSDYERRQTYRRLERYPVWGVFCEAVSLADLIDNFLATLESDQRLAGLARDCRDELDLLLVLADLCEDIGSSLAAREARYLHEQALALTWDQWSSEINGDVHLLLEEDEESEME